MAVCLFGSQGTGKGQVTDLIFMGRLTLERSHIQERSEGVLTAGVWGGECAGAVIAPWLVGEKQGKNGKQSAEQEQKR